MKARTERCRVYEPEAIKTVGWAFDKALSDLSAQSQRQQHIRQELARCIFELYDHGETNPVRLSKRAFDEFFSYHSKVSARRL